MTKKKQQKRGTPIKWLVEMNKDKAAGKKVRPWGGDTIHTRV